MRQAHELPATSQATTLAGEISALVPEISTARLKLRAIRLSDFDALAKIACSERAKYIGGPFSRGDAWHEFTQLAGGWVLHGHGGWTIEMDDQICGFVLIGVEPGDHEREVGYSLLEGFEGQGIASEAAQAALEYGFSKLGFPTLVSYIDPKNARSIKVAERLGGTRDQSAEQKLKHDMHVYRYLNKGVVA